MTPAEFEKLARPVMSSYFGVELSKLKLPDHPKEFDFVSPDGQIVGDAKYYKLVRGISTPPAKWATISEHVWFLEKIDAREKFLVFGNDRRVPAGWLNKWGALLQRDTHFYFLGHDGNLEELPVA